MSFRVANMAALVKYNSNVSCKFLSNYETFVLDKIRQKESEPTQMTFAPSSFRCSRCQWFRLRGVEPDVLKNPDAVLNFTAEVGTARHTVIQNNLKELFQENWIDVEEFLNDTNNPHDYVCTKSENGLETLIEFKDYPVRFAVDGIVKIDGEYYLLEIKTSEHNSFADLTDPKSIHIDQVKCYCALLGIKKVLMVYEDRQYGDLKCYELQMKQYELDDIFKSMDTILEMVQCNLAPERLPKGDYMCSNCKYKQKCKDWG